MVSAPFFSVIVPVYQVAPYLRVSLDSIVRAWEAWAAADATLHLSTKATRTKPGPPCHENGSLRSHASPVLPAVECICIDDGSTDGSGAILDEYAARNDSGIVFRVFHQPNAGVGPARNRALDEARGDWILFVDADDVVSPAFFRYLHGALAGSSIDLLKFGIEKKDVQRPPESIHETPPVVYDVSAPENAHIVSREAIGALLLWNVCFRRQVIGEVRVEPFQPGEDMLFAAVCLTRANHLAVTRTVLYVYVQRPGSCMHAMSPRRVRDFIQTTLRFNQVLREWPMSVCMGRQIRKEFLGGYCGGVLKWVLRLPRAERKPLLETYCKTGRSICALWGWPDPFLCGFSFFYVRYYLNWRVKSMLIRMPWVKRLVLRVRGVK